MGQEELAALRFAEALELVRRIGHVQGIAVSLANLGWVGFYQGNMERAVAQAQESLRLSCLLGEHELLAEDLEILAAAAVATGDASRAAQLLGAAEAIWQVLHVPREAADHSTRAHAQAVTALHGLLAQDTLDAAWLQGQSMGLDAVVALALGCANNVTIPGAISWRVPS